MGRFKQTTLIAAQLLICASAGICFYFLLSWTANIQRNNISEMVKEIRVKSN